MLCRVDWYILLTKVTVYQYTLRNVIEGLNIQQYCREDLRYSISPLALEVDI